MEYFNYQFNSASLKSFKSASFFALFNELNEFSSNFALARIMRFWIIPKVRKLDRLLLQVEKSDRLSGVLAGIVENIIRTFLSMCTSALLFLSILRRHAVLWNAEDYLHYQVSCLKSLIALFLDDVSASGLEFAYNALVSVVALSLVFQYLIGYVDRGGTKTYNFGSLEFRASYVSLLLFQGAYVWLKFRDVAPHRSVYRRSRKDEFGNHIYFGKYEPRFKPPREKDVITGRALKFDYLPLGGYGTQLDAEVVCQIAGFYYGKDEGRVVLEGGSHFSIPAMSEQERGLRGKEKRKWVREKVKEVVKEFNEEKAARGQPRRNTLSANAGEQVDAGGFSSSADQAGAALSTVTNGSDDEFVNFLLGHFVEYGPMMSLDAEIRLNTDVVADSFQEGSETILSMQESLNEQLNLQKEQLETEFNRRLSEQHQRYQRLEMENLELRRENERLKSIHHQVLKSLRSYTETSTKI